MKWEKVKKKGIPPTSRSGMGVITDRNRMVCMGGVNDEEGKDGVSKIHNIFFYSFSIIIFISALHYHSLLSLILLL